MTFTFNNFPANQTLYVWLDGHSYDYSYFTVPIIDGTTTITTDGSGHTTFSMTLTDSQAGGTFNMYFAPTLYNGDSTHGYFGIVVNG